MAKVTIPEKRAWVTAYKKRVARYENQGLEVPHVSRIAKNMGVNAVALKSYLKEANISYEVNAGSDLRNVSPLQHAI